MRFFFPRWAARVEEGQGEEDFFRYCLIGGSERESEFAKGGLVWVTGPWPESVIIELGQTGN